MRLQEESEIYSLQIMRRALMANSAFTAVMVIILIAIALLIGVR